MEQDNSSIGTEETYLSDEEYLEKIDIDDLEYLEGLSTLFQQIDKVRRNSENSLVTPEKQKFPVENPSKLNFTVTTGLPVIMAFAQGIVATVGATGVACFCGNVAFDVPDRERYMEYTVGSWLKDSEARIAGRTLTEKEKIKETLMGVHRTVGDAYRILVNSTTFENVATFDEFKTLVKHYWSPLLATDVLLSTLPIFNCNSAMILTDKRNAYSELPIMGSKVDTYMNDMIEALSSTTDKRFQIVVKTGTEIKALAADSTLLPRKYIDLERFLSFLKLGAAHAACPKEYTEGFRSDSISLDICVALNLREVANRLARLRIIPHTRDLSVTTTTNQVLAITNSKEEKGKIEEGEDEDTVLYTRENKVGYKEKYNKHWKNKKRDFSKVQCNACGHFGHIRKVCPRIRNGEKHCFSHNWGKHSWEQCRDNPVNKGSEKPKL